MHLSLRGLSFCWATWSFSNVSATLRQQPSASIKLRRFSDVERCRIKMLMSRSSPLMCQPHAYGQVLMCRHVQVTTKESIRLLYSIDNRVRRATWLERSLLAWFNRQTDTALITRLSTGRFGLALAWFCWPWPWPSYMRAGPGQGRPWPSL